MTKPKGKPDNTGRKQAGDAAKKQPRRKGKPAGDNTPKKTPGTAYLVWGDGTDEDIAARFAAKVPDWSEWTEREQRGAVALMRKFWDHPVAPTLTVQRDEAGAVNLVPVGENATLQILRQAETFATNSTDLIDDRLGDLANYFHKANKGGATSRNMNASLAFIRGGNPEDTVQSALLTQMSATHDAAMRSLALIGTAQFVDQQNSYGNLSTKLLNAYARQAETLAKLQRGGEQTVRHVYVDARTQTAINYPPAQTNLSEQSHEQDDTSTFSPSMLGYDPAWNSVPVPGDEEPQPVSPARRKGGGAEG